MSVAHYTKLPLPLKGKKGQAWRIFWKGYHLPIAKNSNAPRPPRLRVLSEWQGMWPLPGPITT